MGAEGGPPGGIARPQMMNVEEIYQRGFQYRCEGRYAEARAEFQKVLSVDAAHMKSRHQLGLIQGFEGDFDGQVATLRGLAAQYPNSADVLFDLGMALAMIGDFDAACASFRRVLDIDPTHSRAVEQLAYC